jgi:hypothetical protein
MAPSISFALENITAKGGNKAVVYLTDDPSVNRLTLTLYNTSKEGISLKGGAPVSETARKDGDAVGLYLNFGSSIPAASLKTMVFTTDKWSATLLPGGWVLSPAEDIRIPAGDSVAFVLDKFVTEQRSPSGTLSIDYYGIGPSSPDTFQLKYFLQSPPKPGLKDLNLNLDFVKNGNIALTPTGAEGVLNELSFTLSNPDSNDPLVGPDAPAQTATPTFRLSFVPGETPGYESLATKEQIKNFGVKQVAVNAKEGWVITKPGLDPEAELVWTLVPKIDQVLGTGPSGVVQFQISNVVSTLQPGPTLLYLQYQDIPGYNNGYFSLPINKYVLPVISKFSASPKGFAFNKKDQEIAVYFSWEVLHDYANLRIEPIYRSLVTSSVLSRNLVSAPSSGTTRKMVDPGKLDWILSVEDPLTGTIISKTCHLPGEFEKLALNLTVTPYGLDFSKNDSVTVHPTWAVTGMNSGPFLNEVAVAPHCSGFEYKIDVSKSELDETAKVPGVSGIVLKLGATNLEDVEMRTSLFMPRTNWPVSFPNMAKVESVTRRVFLNEPDLLTPDLPSSYKQMIDSWNISFLPALISNQRASIIGYVYAVYELKEMKSEGAYSIKRLNHIKKIINDVVKSYYHILKETVMHSKSLEAFITKVERINSGAPTRPFDGSLYWLEKQRVILMNLQTPIEILGRPFFNLIDNLNRIYPPALASSKDRYAKAILDSFGPDFPQTFIKLTIEQKQPDYL